MEELSTLLKTLEEIGNSNEDLYDTDVKEKMNKVIIEIFINENTGFVMPESFGMFSKLCDQKIKNSFETLRSNLNTKKLDRKTKFLLLSSKGLITKNKQISECFFGEIIEDSLTRKVPELSCS